MYWMASEEWSTWCCTVSGSTPACSKSVMPVSRRDEINEKKHEPQLFSIICIPGSEDSRTPEVFDCLEVGFNIGAAREALRQR